MAPATATTLKDSKLATGARTQVSSVLSTLSAALTLQTALAVTLSRNRIPAGNCKLMVSELLPDDW